MKIGLLGFGTVGKGCYDILSPHEGFHFTKVASLPPLPELPGAVVTSDPLSAATSPDVDLVVELMGGLHPAYECVKAALSAGKHVVTANKHLVAQFYEELVSLAREKGVCFRYSAAVGGGIPWLPALSRARRLGRVEKVWGIFNGTTNLILDEMTRDGVSYADALRHAKELGFAEANPAADVEGWDARRKICISANIAFDAAIREEEVPTFGITLAAPADVQAARRMDCVIKLIGRAARTPDGVAAWVEPAFVPAASREGVVHGGDNVITYVAEHVGEESFFGPGAGRYPTGFAVAQDILDIKAVLPGPYTDKVARLPVRTDEVKGRYYCRPLDPSGKWDDLREKDLGEGFITRPVDPATLHTRCREKAFLAALPEA
ncbi:MAG: homoserine dehydrogenase [Clostridia bacterium]|nr:homoserine dehydrogenase [Clostridia bacterium]